MPTDKRQRQREARIARQRELERARKRKALRNRLIAGGVLGLVVVAVFVIASQSGSKKKTAKPASTTVPTTTPAGPTTTGATAGPPKATPVAAGAKITGPTPCPKADGSSPRTSSFAKAPTMCIDPAKKYSATFDTTEGPVVVDLDTKTTPGTANNFVVLSRYHYYDGSSLHRIDTSIDIIQGGSPSTQTLADPGPGYTIKDEGDSKTRHYKAGDLVMARSQGPDSGGAQFFFVTGPKASALDSQGTYVTFGKVQSGLDVLQKIVGLYQACPEGDQQCLGGAPSHVVLVKMITIKES